MKQRLQRSLRSCREAMSRCCEAVARHYSLITRLSFVFVFVHLYARCYAAVVFVAKRFMLPLLRSAGEKRSVQSRKDYGNGRSKSPGRFREIP